MKARDRVTSHIAKQARRFPDLEIALVETTGLEPRDASLARAIEHGVLRRWLTLATIIDSRLNQDWDDLEPNVQAPLLVGAAQLLLLDRLPDHAVINEAVNWTKQHARAKAGGLVNAVLRKVSQLRNEIVETHDPRRRDELPLADGRAWRLHEELFAEDPIERQAQWASLSSSVLGHWIGCFGSEQAQTLVRHSLVHAPIILTGLNDQDEATASLLTAHDQSGHFVLTGSYENLMTLMTEHPNARVQDPTSAEPVAATAGMNPSIIIDYCAGVGTKTAQLLDRHPDARIIATDKNKERLALLRDAMAHQKRVEVVDFSKIHDYDGTADLLLLDVPCSNSGVLARRVEAKYRLNEDSVARLVGIQRQIVADSLPLLSESGRILYATCSVEPAENNQQTEWITKWHPLRVVSAAGRMPKGEPGEPKTAYRDGGYFALLEPTG